MNKIHAPLLPLTVCLIAGIAVRSWLPEWTVGLGVLAAGVAVAALLWRRPRLQSWAICGCFVLLGMTLGRRAGQQLTVEWPEGQTLTEAVVVSEPQVRERTVVCDVLTLGDNRRVRCRFDRDTQSEQIALGNGLAMYTSIKKVHAWKRGHFDYQQYMASHGFSGEAFVGHGRWQWRELSLQGLSLWERCRLRALLLRHQLLQHYREWRLRGDAYGLIAAMSLGEKTQMNPELKEVYARVGASHVLALSGLHLMIIYGVLTMLFRWRRLFMVSQVLTVLAVWAFVFLVGLAPSVVRAALMITVYALLALGYRDRMSVNTLAFVAMIMLVVSPLSLYDVGFQLSFTAVLAIVTFNPLLQSFIPLHVQLEHRWLRYLWGLTTVSLSAQVGTAPLVAYYFGRFPTWFLLSNYVVIPLAAVVLYLTLALVLTAWWTALQQLLLGGVMGVAWLMNHALQSVARLPLSSVEPLSPSAFQVALLYVVIVCCYVLLSLWRKNNELRRITRILKGRQPGQLGQHFWGHRV